MKIIFDFSDSPCITPSIGRVDEEGNQPGDAPHCWLLPRVGYLNFYVQNDHLLSLIRWKDILKWFCNLFQSLNISTVLWHLFLLHKNHITCLLSIGGYSKSCWNLFPSFSFLKFVLVLWWLSWRIPAWTRRSEKKWGNCGRTSSEVTKDLRLLKCMSICILLFIFHFYKV